MYFRAHRGLLSAPGRGRALGMALLLAGGGVLIAWGKPVSRESKQIIGGTAVLSEASSGLSFRARIDTGAASCSLHVEEMTIENESSERRQNVGKPVRFRVRGRDGQTAWVETTIAEAVRVRSSVLDEGEYDRRYKVPLTLQWKDFRKEVLVTIADRSNMTFPLLIGRNFLHGDFLVDVALKDDDASAPPK